MIDYKPLEYKDREAQKRAGDQMRRYGTDLDQRIAGLFPSASRRESKDMCYREIDSRLTMLEKEHKGNLNAYRKQD